MYMRKDDVLQKDFISDLISGGLRVVVNNQNSLIISTTDKTIKSVSSPTAQSNTLCVHGYNWGLICDELVEGIELVKKESMFYYWLFMVMYYSGCRVSEVLKVKYKDIMSDDCIYLHASKNSEDRVIRVPGIREYFKNNLFLSEQYVFNVSRFSVYRSSIRYKLNIVNCGLFVDKPTKLFRYALASRVYSDTKKLEVVAKLLGHKNIDNSRFYIFELANVNEC